MRAPLVMPLAGGFVFGLVLYGLSFVLPYLTICIVAFLLISMLAMLLSPLGSGPAFSGWIKASPTAISGMNSEIRSRSRWSTSDKLGGLIFLAMSVLVYLVATVLLPS